MPRTATFAILAFLGVSYGTVAQAEGPSTSAYPYGTQWKNNRYGPVRPWLSAGAVMGIKPSRTSVNSETQTQTLVGIEGRYHFSPRFALILGTHFTGHTLEATQKWSSAELQIADKTLYTEYSYRETALQLGADFGVWETKAAHLQVGPRLGFQRWSTSLDLTEGSDGKELNDTEEWVKAARKSIGAEEVAGTDPMAGATLRFGVFPRPFIELGLHAHYEMIFSLIDGQGALGTGAGLEFGPYAIAHF